MPARRRTRSSNGRYGATLSQTRFTKSSSSEVVPWSSTTSGHGHHVHSPRYSAASDRKSAAHDDDDGDGEEDDDDDDDKTPSPRVTRSSAAHHQHSTLKRLRDEPEESITNEDDDDDDNGEFVDEWGARRMTSTSTSTTHSLPKKKPRATSRHSRPSRTSNDIEHVHHSEDDDETRTSAPAAHVNGNVKPPVRSSSRTSTAMAMATPAAAPAALHAFKRSKAKPVGKREPPAIATDLPSTASTTIALAATASAASSPVHDDYSRSPSPRLNDDEDNSVFVAPLPVPVVQFPPSPPSSPEPTDVHYTDEISEGPILTESTFLTMNDRRLAQARAGLHPILQQGLDQLNELKQQRRAAALARREEQLAFIEHSYNAECQIIDNQINDTLRDWQDSLTQSMTRSARLVEHQQLMAQFLAHHQSKTASLVVKESEGQRYRHLRKSFTLRYKLNDEEILTDLGTIKKKLKTEWGWVVKKEFLDSRHGKLELNNKTFQQFIAETTLTLRIVADTNTSANTDSDGLSLSELVEPALRWDVSARINDPRHIFPTGELVPNETHIDSDKVTLTSPHKVKAKDKSQLAVASISHTSSASGGGGSDKSEKPSS